MTRVTCHSFLIVEGDLTATGGLIAVRVAGL